MAKRRRKSQYIFAPELNQKKSHSFLRGFVLILLVLAFGCFITNYIMDHQLEYDRQKVTITTLPGDLESWSILHFSDLHGRELGENQGIIRNTLGSNVRVSSVVFTGDMLGKDGDVSAFLDLVALLPAGTPKLYVPGDEDPPYLDPTPHGSVSPLADWAVTLIDAGVTILDEPLLFTRGRNDSARIWFVPEYLYELDVDNLESAYAAQLNQLTGSLTAEQAARKRVAEYQIARAQRIREAKRSMLPTDVQIALTHTPLTSPYITEMMAQSSQSGVFSLRNVSLFLAGHYCAGQVRLPILGAVYVPDFGWFPEDSLLMGMGRVGGIPQYVNRGLGSSGYYPYMPFRLFNNPGMAYIQLTANLF